MALNIEVYKWHRVVLVRFERAKVGDPDIKIPQPDDRAYGSPERGPIFGVLQGDTVKVRLRREEIGTDAPLFVSSSDEKVFTVEDPSPNKLLPDAVTMDIKIKGVGGGTPKKAKLEVHYATAKSSPLKGPTLHEATIWVWHPPLDLRVTPHLVTIERATGPAPHPALGSTADVEKILEVAKAIWRPCGIRLIKEATKPERIPLATEGVIIKDYATTRGGGEIDRVLSLNNVPHTVNAYFFRRFSTDGTLGVGISSESQKTYGLSNNGILLADIAMSGTKVMTHDVQWSGNDLAHEIGHFLTLAHVEKQNASSARNDTWSRRSLMHPTNGLVAPYNPFQQDIGYGTVTSAGVTSGRRGALISMKDLAQLTTDGECTKARGGVSAI